MRQYHAGLTAEPVLLNAKDRKYTDTSNISYLKKETSHFSLMIHEFIIFVYSFFWSINNFLLMTLLWTSDIAKPSYNSHVAVI